jgi:methylenetetrahydrofolate dehydrogenase (NADP+)/methenyltetrahydrofolate cyclohydrolase
MQDGEISKRGSEKGSEVPGTTMVLDGKALAKAYGEITRERARQLTQRLGRAPGLAVIVVGDNPASKAYVAAKQRRAQALGLATFDSMLPATTSAEELHRVIDRYNHDEAVDGILLQLPLPEHLPVAEFLRALAPEKDVDGLHPFNQGLLLQGREGMRPCTPLGIMMLIDRALSRREGVDVGALPQALLRGKSAVVIGRSLLVGKPTALLLLERDATVTIAHSKTPDLARVCREADIVVAAVGVPRLVRKEWIKPGAVVIDVGINRQADGTLVGDVAYDEVAPLCAAITPVPGGVGPMTVEMLIANTVDACRRRT